MKACCVSVNMKDSRFNTMIRQITFKTPSDNINYIFNHAHDLFTKNYKWSNPLRSVGVRVDGLHAANWEQSSLFNDRDHAIKVDIDSRIKELTGKFGKIDFEKSAASKELMGS